MITVPFDYDEWQLICSALLDFKATGAEEVQCYAMVAKILREISGDNEDDL